MPEDVKTVEEPSAPTVADAWDEHGTPIVTAKPEPPKKEESAASATPAKQAKPEGKPKSEAEPGAAKQEPKPRAKPTAEERISEVIAERKAAEKRASGLEERIRILEAAAKPPAQAESKPKEPPKRPNPFNWTGTQEEYDKAMDDYEAARDAAAVARALQQQAQSEAQKSMSEMLKQAVVNHPDAEAKIKSATTEIMGKAPTFVQAFVNDSEVLGELLYTLADQTMLDNLLETAKANPGKALRVLRDMELDIQKALSKPAEQKQEAKPKEEAPEQKPRAPKPPSEVGGRGASSEDAAVAAAKDGNFGAFDAEQKRRYMRAS